MTTTRPADSAAAQRGGPGRWDVESVLAAIRAWAAETGDAGRGSTSGRRRRHARSGLENATVLKWERDRPRWPATDTVRYHFGRFNQALEAAGLPARPLVFELPLPERIEAYPPPRRGG